MPHQLSCRMPVIRPGIRVKRYTILKNTKFDNRPDAVLKNVLNILTITTFDFNVLNFQESETETPLKFASSKESPVKVDFFYFNCYLFVVGCIAI